VINHTEAEERIYLEQALLRLHKALNDLDTQIDGARKAIIESKKYVYANRDQLDPAERAANIVEISLSIDKGESAVVKRSRLQKLAQVPYFGRVDFSPDDRMEGHAYYIGIHSFSDETGQDNEIYDWRSPVASLFYDYNVGRALYMAPEGEVEGNIDLKRQYRIRQGVMEYMIESNININDEVLQRELSQTSDEKMKNIVATIQKEQNQIIRNEYSHELIIQGVAGSGKTSVALHRIAFLLYRYKGTLTSDNMLIVSPNKVFSDYISNVLPELGEEKIAEIGFDAIAASELSGSYQTFDEQVSELATSTDDSLIERIRYKANIEFVQQMDDFVRYIGESYFSPADINLDGVHVDKVQILEVYQVASALPLKLRVEKTATVISERTRNRNGMKVDRSTMNKIKTAIKKMVKTQGLLANYMDFYHYIGRPELFKFIGKKKLEYSDVFPMVYLKIRLEGPKGYEAVKHLLVDEMQDYTAVQYAVLSLLFKCKKTILGDHSQSVNPYSSSSIADIKKVFPEADTVELLRSYRSTFEIIEFIRRLNPSSKIIPIERHGEEPQIIQASDRGEEMMRIKQLLMTFKESGNRTLGIICKTQNQAEMLYEELNQTVESIHLLTFSSEKFHEGVILTSAHMAKGLEFDQVIVPFVDAANYKSELDRSLLYIACSRAMHRLAVTYHGAISSFISVEVDR
jgi:DNA helicase-2/ATP-dependent DNA helicase PcrA